jgi:hypothetical protein
MEKNEVFKCSFYGCNKSIRQNVFLDIKSPPINDEAKLELIIDSILVTKLFCINCSINHAISICENSKIRIER